MLVSSDELKAQLKKYLKELRLPTILKCYEEQGQRAGEEGLSFEQYLLCLLELECEVRRQNRIARLLRESKLPLEKRALRYFEWVMLGDQSPRPPGI